jgi:hypothetical protein
LLVRQRLLKRNLLGDGFLKNRLMERAVVRNTFRAARVENLAAALIVAKTADPMLSSIVVIPPVDLTTTTLAS